MLKFYEMAAEFSCWNKAKREEMVFVLLARDRCAPWAIYFWCLLRIITFKNKPLDHQIVEAIGCARFMSLQRKSPEAEWHLFIDED